MAFQEFLGIYRYLDATPKGRNEDGPYHALADWVHMIGAGRSRVFGNIR